MKRSLLVALAVICGFYLVFSIVPSGVASASTVGYTPITGVNVGALLQSLGYVDPAEGGGWLWNNILGDYYTQDIFGNYVPKIKSGDVLTNNDLSPLLGTVIPENLYTTDGSGFYVGSKAVTTDDMFLNAKSLVGLSYNMPTNIVGAQYTLGAVSGDSTTNYTFYGLCYTPKFDYSLSLGEQDYYFVFVSTPNGSFVYPQAITMVSDKNCYTYNFFQDVFNNRDSVPIKKYLLYPLGINRTFLTSDNTSGYPNTEVNYNAGMVNDPNKPYSNFVLVAGSGSYSNYSPDVKHVVLQTRGLPVRSVEGDSSKLDNAIVQVKKDDDDNNNGQSPVPPQSPDYWQLWQTVEELVEEVDSGTITNAGTTFKDYVNNNYIYNKVEINVPDKVENNVNIGGGLSVSGSGDINVTVHEDVSLPSAGDGSAFYSPDVTDVIGALGNDNPVISVVSGLFSALDPALVGVFSVSVSLLFVLGLWKLIRG